MLEFSQIPVWGVLALPAIALLWYVSLRRNQRNSFDRSRFSTEYFKGLNYLLNDEQDKALEIFVKLVETDWNIIDTHFALGKIFRKNGEIDKAIKIHQGLMARPSLPEKYRDSVLLELGYDYLGAGWFDRAESLFKEVLVHDPGSDKALRHLIMIYEQEKDWYKAIDVAETLYGMDPERAGPMISQYFCELAAVSMAKGDRNQAAHNANKALRYDPASVRASILLADIAMSSGDYGKARDMLQQIERQDAEFMPVIIDKLITCHHHQNDAEALLAYLDQLEKRQSGLPLLKSHAKVIEIHKGRKAAIDYVIEKLKKRPSLYGIQQLVSYSVPDSQDDSAVLMDGLRGAVEMMQVDQAAYQCKQCGFKANTLYWLCPSCHSWGSVKPYACEPAC